mmetsp:Transcript_16785/g.29921  ORF Transcript_16785/g.29921 Transcript_16785/m.29921 type:complete len:236 (+) Transcript_16785:283-990(+)
MLSRVGNGLAPFIYFPRPRALPFLSVAASSTTGTGTPGSAGGVGIGCVVASAGSGMLSGTAAGGVVVLARGAEDVKAAIAGSLVTCASSPGCCATTAAMSCSDAPVVIAASLARACMEVPTAVSSCFAFFFRLPGVRRVSKLSGSCGATPDFSRLRHLSFKSTVVRCLSNVPSPSSSTLFHFPFPCSTTRASSRLVSAGSHRLILRRLLSGSPSSPSASPSIFTDAVLFRFLLEV